MHKSYLSLLLMSLSVTPMHAEDWPFYGLNSKNRRNPSESSIDKHNVQNLAIKWTYDTIAPVVCHPSVVDGTAYFGDAVGFVYAVDAASGALKWQTYLANPAPLSNPVTASVVPVFDFPGIFSTPTIKGSKVYISTFNAYVAVLDKDTGTILQTQLMQKDPDYPQVCFAGVGLVDNKNAVIASLGTFEPGQIGQTTSSNGQIIALKASDISVELWNIATSKNPSNPLTDGGSGVGIWGSTAYDKDRNLLYIGTGNNWEVPVTPIADSLLALDATSGNIAWHTQFTDDDIGGVPDECSPTGVKGKNWDVGMSPILVKIKLDDDTSLDVVVVGQKSGMLHCVNRATGELLWNTVLTNPNPDGSGFGGINSSGCSDGKVVYVASHYSTDGLPFEATFAASSHAATGIFAVRARDGALLWRVDVPSLTVGPLTVVNNVVFHTAYDGTLRAFNVNTGKKLWEFSNTDTTANHLSGGTSIQGEMLYLPTGSTDAFTPSKVIAFELSDES